MFIHILVFGDSIALGAWDAKGGGWVDRLKKYLYGDKYRIKIKTDSGLLVYSTYNLAVGGATTDDLVESFGGEMKERVSSDPEKRKEDIVIFAIGINDSYYVGSKDNSRVSLDKFKKNLNKLKNQAQEITSNIIFIGLTKVDKSKTMSVSRNKSDNYANENIKKYDAAIRAFCKQNKILFIPMLNLLKKEDLKNGLHPNSQGHQKMFERVRDFLIENKLIGG